MSESQLTKDEAKARLTIARAFPAEPARVWRYLSEPALLDQWWAPAPWKTATVHMDFRVGGYWLYAMNGPQGEQHFGRMDYLEIVPEQRYKAADVFCDAEGKAIESLPRQTFENTLTAAVGSTRLVTVVQYASAEDMHRILEMGMQQGITTAYEQLDALLAA